jgi:hypothetical protein
MSYQAKFPQKLLKRPWIERLEFFHARKIVHEKMESVADEIVSAIRHRAGEGFIFVVGPTRIGKTTVLEYVVNNLLNESMDKMRNDPGCIPVAWMATSPYHRGYDWKDHWVGCLEAINEPLIEHKTTYGDAHFDREKFTRGGSRDSRTITMLRRAFEGAARERHLRVFCVDEAQHLTLVPYSKMYLAQLEIIKSVASLSKAMHVLFGTYDLLKLRNANGQLGSRAVTVHFSRYRPDNNADIEEFARAVVNLTALMPFKVMPDFSKDLDYCFDTCLGCVGLLKVWFTDALGAAMENGEKTLTRRTLERNEPPIDVLDKISSEIVDGETMLEQHENKRSLIKLRMLQGSKYREPESQDGAANSVAKNPKNDVISSTSKSKKGAKKVKRVERKPKRDKVGEGRKKNVA